VYIKINFTTSGFKPRRANVFDSFLEENINYLKEDNFLGNILVPAPDPVAPLRGGIHKKQFTTSRFKPRRANVFGSFLKKNIN
jgi:hypothetical protein